jgi:hypothetical protein
VIRYCRAGLITGVLLLVFAGCNSTQKAGELPVLSSTAPAWLQNTQSVYPSDKFLTGRGTAKSIDEAQSAALQDIARVFGVEVSSTIGMSQSFSDQDGKVTENSELVIQSLNRTYAQLFDLRYADSWQNSQTKEYEALAYINREEAWGIYEPRLNQSLDVFKSLWNAALRERDQKKKYYLYTRAQAVSGETTQMLNYAGVLAPDKSKDYDDIRSNIARLPARLSQMAYDLGIEESTSRIETLNYYFSATFYDPSSTQARDRLNQELDVPVGAGIRMGFERQAQWEKDLNDFSAFYTEHPPFALYHTQFGSPPVLDYQNKTFDLDFYASLRRTDGLQAMQKVLENLRTQLDETGLKDDWGFSGWPENAPVFKAGLAGRTFQCVAGLINERGETVATAPFEMQGILLLTGQSELIQTDSTQDLHVVFSKVPYDASKITDNLQVQILSIDGKDSLTAGLEGYINIIPAPELPIAQAPTIPQKTLAKIEKDKKAEEAAKAREQSMFNTRLGLSSFGGLYLGPLVGGFMGGFEGGYHWFNIELYFRMLFGMDDKTHYPESGLTVMGGGIVLSYAWYGGRWMLAAGPGFEILAVNRVKEEGQSGDANLAVMFDPIVQVRFDYNFLPGFTVRAGYRLEMIYDKNYDRFFDKPRASLGRLKLLDFIFIGFGYYTTAFQGVIR